MLVFNTFFKIAKKRMLSACIYFSIYATLTIVLSQVGQDNYTDNFKASQLSISIIDEDKSTASDALIHYLSSIHEVNTTFTDKEELMDCLYYRTIRYSLTIPNGFEDDLVNGYIDDLVISQTIPGSNSSHYINQQINQYLSAIQLYILSGQTITAAIDATNHNLASLPRTEQISFQSKEVVGGTNIYYMFQYLPYIFIVMLFASLAPILITLNKPELKSRMACSTLTPFRRTAELTVSCLVYVLLTWCLFMLLSICIYGLDILKNSNILLAALNSFVFLILAMSMTLFISTFHFDDNILNMTANIIGLSLSFISGVFVPATMLPDSVLNVAKLFPTYWYIRANNMLGGLSRETFDLSLYFQCISIQILYILAIFSVTLVISSRTEKN